jgi:dolichyl-phosphate beta-glucosyltransferase
LISLIVALYNEEKRFAERYPMVRAFLDSLGEPWELLLVDDGSSDGTLSLIRALAAKEPRIRVFKLHRNLGQGAAVKTGVLASRGDIVMYTDADMMVPLSYFQALIERVRAHCDIAIASRWMKGAVITVPQPPLRRILGRIYYRLIHLFLLERIADCNCGLKAYRGEVARTLFGFVRSWRWGFNIEHLWVAHRLKFSLEEVPIVWGHNPDSKVHIVRDCFFTLWELGLLELRRLMGGYPKIDYFAKAPRDSSRCG